MTNLILNFSKSQTATNLTAFCILSAMTCGFSLSYHSSAHAADSPNESQAIIAAGPNYKVSESIAIDRLIQKIYANSPLNMAVLRKVLVDANPKVITGNPQQRVKSGTTLVVPDHVEVVRSQLTPYLATAQDASDNNPAARDYQTRKQWVRFP